MTPEQIELLIKEQGPYIFDRMFSAVEKVRERLERACRALREAGVPYAVVGGNAVAAWVATVDDGAVRNTKDVDLLLDEADLDRASAALAAAGFVRDSVMDVIVFLDGPQGKPSQGIHILIADRKIRAGDVTPTPKLDQIRIIESKSVVDLQALVRMKLNSYRDKDRTHLRDMIQVGLIDATWPAQFEPALAERLQALLDDPDG
jgi:hypothetical protein